MYVFLNHVYSIPIKNGSEKENQLKIGILIPVNFIYSTVINIGKHQ